jgi:DNA repair protein RadD
VILLRPTKSLGLYLQMCGRALRPAPGKDYAVVLDHAGNCLRHGLCDDDQEWSLEDRKKRRREAGVPLKRCPDCGAMVPISARACPCCGADFPGFEGAPVVEGDLQIADRDAVARVRVAGMSRWRQIAWAGGDFARLKLVGEVRGYRPGWARYEHERTQIRHQGGDR